ncbi:hypothetical protein [Enterococcus faecalis]|uniref:hypothetical protein n=1 Tax=Enterococcus faecalis TaxID=1351 RepID=UPI00211AC05A|nr:hypothetical protein [Enterococcus faecalis]
MTNFTTEIMETLINKGDLDDLFRRHLDMKYCDVLITIQSITTSIAFALANIKDIELVKILTSSIICQFSPSKPSLLNTHKKINFCHYRS